MDTAIDVTVPEDMTYDMFHMWSNAALEMYLARKGYPHYGML